MWPDKNSFSAFFHKSHICTGNKNKNKNDRTIILCETTESLKLCDPCEHD